MILSMDNLVTKYQEIIPLSVFSRKKFEEFEEILNQDIIKNKFKFSKKYSYDQFINQALSNVYLAKLPDFLHGITLFNRCILINLKANKARYDENLFYWGYTFYVILHELGHYAKRYEYYTDIEWLEFSTPEKFSSRDAGSILEIQLFGKVLDSFSTRTADFMLSSHNWTLSPQAFKKKLSKANKWDNTSSSRRQNIQIRLLSSGKVEFIQLGICCKEMARRSKSLY